jgi:hypothetical protein
LDAGALNCWQCGALSPGERAARARRELEEAQWEAEEAAQELEQQERLRQFLRRVLPPLPPVVHVAWVLGATLGLVALVGATLSVAGACGAFGEVAESSSGVFCMCGGLSGLDDFVVGVVLGVVALCLGVMAVGLFLASLGVRMGSRKARIALACLAGISGLLVLVPCGFALLRLYLGAMDGAAGASLALNAAPWVALALGCWVCCGCALASATKEHCSAAAPEAPQPSG